MSRVPFLLAACLLLTPALAEAPGQEWLGLYRSDQEEVEISRSSPQWLLRIDRIEIPVDGQWHETVPTFAVRHRAEWADGHARLLLFEQHNQGALWRHEFRLEDGRLLKFAIEPSGQTTLIRRYRRSAAQDP